MRHRYVSTIAGAPRSLRHGCRSHQVGTQWTERRMFLLDPKSLVGQSHGPRDLASQWGPVLLGLRNRSEASTVQALMDLALPRFEGLGDGPHQVHKPWKISADSPASPDTSRVDTSGVEDRVVLSSPCLNLDELSSSDDDAGGSVGLSDLSVTLLCGSDDDITPVYSDQVLSDVDLPPESVSHDKRQVIRIRDASPDVQIVDISQVGPAWDSRQTVSSGDSGKRMPLPLCISGVEQMSTHPPAITPFRPRLLVGISMLLRDHRILIRFRWWDQ